MDRLKATKAEWAAYQKEWRKNNPEKAKLHRDKANKKQCAKRKVLGIKAKPDKSPKRLARYKKYYEKNKTSFNYKAKLRLLNREKRTPKWADKEKILEIYKNCPKGYHVDHIIPLHGKLVTGLHVEYNLQYLTKEDNLKKGNSYEI